MTVTGAVAQARFDPNATLFVCGFRGVGKTTCALMIATHLGRPFIDCDKAFTKRAGCNPSKYIARHSWDAFRDLETQILCELLQKCSQGHVIACGGGVVERHENRALLTQYGQHGGLVLHVMREQEHVMNYLFNEKTLPQWEESIRTVWSKRFPLYEQVSTHTYYSLTAEKDPAHPSLALKYVETALLKFVERLFASAPQPLPSRDRRTYALILHNLDCENLDAGRLEIASSGADAIELRVDELRARRPLGTPFGSPQNTPSPNPGAPSFADVAFALARLRRTCDLPLIFTLRTVKQSGRFVLDEASEPTYLQLIYAAFKLGVEYVDLELDLGPRIIQRIVADRPSTTKLILSHFDSHNALKWHLPEVQSLRQHAIALGADIVKITLRASSVEDTEALASFTEEAQRQTFSRDPEISEITEPPIIAVNAGKLGENSGIYNHLFTPITHPVLAQPFDPWLPTFASIQKALIEHGLASVRSVAIQPASCSIDRALAFQAGLRMLNLPYRLTASLDSDNLAPGGALVELTTPTEESRLAAVDYRARRIGIIDTVSWLDQDQGTEACRNVRSIALGNVIRRNLTPINMLTDETAALFFGGSDALVSRQGLISLLLETKIRCIQCLWCDPSLSDSRLQHVASLRSLRHPLPTLIIACTYEPLNDGILLDILRSPTGGTLVDLTTRSGPSPWKLWMRDKHMTAAWVVVTARDVDLETVKLQFQYITGCRLPAQALQQGLI